MNEIINLLNPWWFNRGFNTGIERGSYKRRILAPLKSKQAILLVGSRRVGKTTLIYQIISELLKKIPAKRIFYVLLDHPQISSQKILDLVSEFRKQFLHDRKTKIYLFFDEVQYVKDWEREIKALIDTENVKIFLSGSASSNLLVRSPYLTGRIERIDIFPLDFAEFLSFKKQKISETEVYKFEKLTDEYLKTGGYPEYVLQQNPAYFSDLVNNILFKDIVNLYQLRNPEILRDLILLLADRVGSQTTFSKLAKILSLKNDTVKEYLFYLKNTFLIDELPRFSSSRAARIYGPKKFYTTDNGLLFHLLGRLSYGAAFEQTVFNFLRRRQAKINFYYEDQKEIDFVVEKGDKKELWEVKYETDLKFSEKISNYLETAKFLKAEKLVFVTKNLEKEIKTKEIKIQFLPLWRIFTSFLMPKTGFPLTSLGPRNFPRLRLRP